MHRAEMGAESSRREQTEGIEREWRPEEHPKRVDSVAHKCGNYKTERQVCGALGVPETKGVLVSARVKEKMADKRLK